MRKILLTSEIHLEIEAEGDADAFEKTENWHKKVGDFLLLVDRTLVNGVRFKDIRINIVEIKKGP